MGSHDVTVCLITLDVVKTLKYSVIIGEYYSGAYRLSVFRTTPALGVEQRTDSAMVAGKTQPSNGVVTVTGPRPRHGNTSRHASLMASLRSITSAVVRRSLCSEVR